MSGMMKIMSVLNWKCMDVNYKVARYITIFHSTTITKIVSV